MSRTQPNSSPTDEYARRIARAIAKGRPPLFSAAFDRYCESSPREIFAAFAGVARHMPPAGEDEPLAVGYLFVLQRLLEHPRYRAGRGRQRRRKRARLGGRRPTPLQDPRIAGANRCIGKAGCRLEQWRTSRD